MWRGVSGLRAAHTEMKQRLQALSNELNVGWRRLDGRVEVGRQGGKHNGADDIGMGVGREAGCFEINGAASRKGASVLVSLISDKRFANVPAR